MYKLFIADDEQAIREGIKYIVDWQELNYEIIGEAGNGEDTLNTVLNAKPDLVLIDIKMPKLSGLEVIEKAVQAGYTGHFIILSGYSDFQYAKQAMKFGVNHYLTKPLDEDELIATVREINDVIAKHESQSSMNDFLRRKSRKEILSDIVTGKEDVAKLDIKSLNLASDIYQVVMYESFIKNTDPLPFQFSELFSLASSPKADTGSALYEHFTVNNIEVLFLRGNSAIDRFRRFLDYYDKLPEKGSPLDSFFIAYGSTVNSLEDTVESYKQASQLISRRFFCTEGQHVLGFNDLPSVQHKLLPFDKNRIMDYRRILIDLLQSFNRRKVAETLSNLRNYLFQADTDISTVKFFMIDLFLQVKDELIHNYSDLEATFQANAEIIEFIYGQNYLYDIISYFSIQFENVMNAIGGSSRESVMDDILYYIEHNYHENIKLEMIAALFGYNSSYLGKVFNKSVGENFNSYVDKVRVQHAIELLSQNNMKVYEVAEKVGYKNVDYFHKKFKKYTGDSPAEYRKKLGIEE